MTHGERLLQHTANLAVGLTGLAYGWMLYLVEPPADDPFAISVANHPWQPETKAAHILLAPLLVLAIGAIWKDHVWARLRNGFAVRRRTGLALALLAAPMIATGYLLQTSVDETWRTAWMWTHVASSCVWILVYLVHQLSPRRARRDPG